MSHAILVVCSGRFALHFLLVSCSRYPNELMIHEFEIIACAVVGYKCVYASNKITCNVTFAHAQKTFYVVT